MASWPDWVNWLILCFGGLVLWVTAFAYLEQRAIRDKANDPRRMTLSMAVYRLSRDFPLAIAGIWLFTGLIVGGLSVHFLWHWCPP